MVNLSHHRGPRYRRLGALGADDLLDALDAPISRFCLRWHAVPSPDGSCYCRLRRRVWVSVGAARGHGPWLRWAPPRELARMPSARVRVPGSVPGAAEVMLAGASAEPFCG